MKLALVFPPLTDPTQPYSSLPALAAFLRSRGESEVLQVDANVEFVRAALTGESLRAAGDEIAQRLERLDSGPPPEGPAATEYALLASALLKTAAVVQGIDGAVRELADPAAFRDLERLDRSKRLVNEAMEVLSAASYPLSLASAPEIASPATLAELAADSSANPFRGFLETDTVPKLVQASPTAVGISITYRGQVLPAVTLALLIRDRLPGVAVVFGGNMVSAWYEQIGDCPALFDWCDYLIPFEGESALAGLLGALGNGRGLDTVPSLVYRQGGRVRKNPVVFEDINRLPTPDYRGLPLDLYLAPQPVFMVNTSRGCYWRRCSFCSVSPALRGRARVRHPDLVHRDLVTLNRRHGARCISFGDDCVAPATLKALASRLREKGPGISWQCEVRFEKALSTDLLRNLREAGCCNLIFGLESYSPRVLDLMKKGVRHEQIGRILADCRRFGIAFNLQFFFGFPGETAEEGEITADFVKRQMHGAATFSFGTFELQRGSEVEKDPAAFGIRRVERDCGALAVKFDYVPRPAHADAARERLRQYLRERIRYRHAGLSINAHTLLFLHESGVAALAEVYRGEPEEQGARLLSGRLMGSRLVPGPRQHTCELAYSPADLLEDHRDGNGDGGRILLYDHDLDRSVEVSRLALWILQHLDGGRTPRQLVERLSAETGEDDAGIAPAVAGVVDHLYGRGFLLIPCD